MVQTLSHLTLSFQEKHGHLHFDDEKFNFTFGDEIRQGFQKLKFGEICNWEINSFSH